MSASQPYRLSTCLCAVWLSFSAPFVSAQNSNTVSLESHDKSVALSGELVEAADGQYKLRTIAGILAIDIDAVKCVGPACPAVLPKFVVGADVKLTSNTDGEANITGKIVDIIEDYYVVDNPVMGVVQIGSEVVDCSGPGCPTGLRFTEEADVASLDVPADVTELESESDIETESASDAQAAETESESEIDAVAAETDSESETDSEPETDAVATETDAIAAETDSIDSQSDANADIESDVAVNADAEGEIDTQTEVVARIDTEQIDPASANISFAGSDTVGLGLLPYLLEDYSNSLNASASTTTLSATETFVRYVGPDDTELASVYVNATGSGEATDALETKTAVFGMTSRPITDEETRRLIATGTTDLRGSNNETVIAVDSLAIVTHPTNPVRTLSMEALGAIYLGLIDNWSQVGGPDAPITVLSREDGSSTRGVFANVVFDGEEPPLAERVTYPGGDNPEMAAAVKADPLAIGYVGFAYSDGLIRLDLTSECGITSTPTSFAVKTEEYPFGRRLYLYNRADNTSEEAERFLNYVLSPEADDAIAKSNFVNFAVERTSQSESRSNGLYDALNLQSAVQLQLANQMKDDRRLWDRLSTTIRFRTGSARLGNKEQNDIERLIGSLSELPEGTRIAAVGFTDDVGPFEQNLQLSQQRAQTVADAIRSIAGERVSDVQIETRSFSELSPSVCNTDTNGRAINRRVEIWVSK